MSAENKEPKDTADQVNQEVEQKGEEGKAAGKEDTKKVIPKKSGSSG